MDVVEILPRLHLLRFPVGQAHLWRDDGLTLAGSGPKGAGAPITGAIRSPGHDPGELRRIVLTHFHEDHAGGAGGLARSCGAQVLAHRLDAPYVRGEAAPPPPRHEDGERALHAAALAQLPEGDPVRPRRLTELSDGDVLGFGGGARVVHAPGRADGSIGVHLPRYGVLFTGDTIAVSPVDGSVVLGVFDLDRARTLAAFRRLAALDPQVACFGHGAPVTGRAGETLRRAAARYEPPV